MRRRPLLVAVLFVIGVVAVGCLVFTGIGTALFNFAVGNNVYVLIVSYQVQPVTVSGTLIMGITMQLNLQSTRVAIETALYGFKTDVAGNSTYNGNFSLTLIVDAYMGNQIPIYHHPFTFQDSEPRTLTCYLQNYDSNNYHVLNAVVTGHYLLEGQQINLQAYQGQWNES
jgi:hypothetical protein